MTELTLEESASVTLDATGGGRVRLGPRAHGEEWSPDVASITTSTADVFPECRVHVGHVPLPENLVDGTFTGNLNSTTNIRGSTLRLGQYVWGVWSGGDPGADATLIVRGTKTIAG